MLPGRIVSQASDQKVDESAYPRRYRPTLSASGHGCRWWRCGTPAAAPRARRSAMVRGRAGSKAWRCADRRQPGPATLRGIRRPIVSRAGTSAGRAIPFRGETSRGARQRLSLNIPRSHPHEGCCPDPLSADRRPELADRRRAAAAGTRRTRSAGARGGDIGEPGGHQGPLAEASGRIRAQGARL